MSSMFHVLIIDDDTEPRESLKKSLLRLGCDVTVSDTAEHGLDKLKTNQFDAVFAALCVRDIGGRSIARWVKKQSADTKFFIITSWKGDLEPRLLQVDGIHDVIHKPFSFSEIRDKVLEHLG